MAAASAPVPLASDPRQMYNGLNDASCPVRARPDGVRGGQDGPNHAWADLAERPLDDPLLKALDDYAIGAMP